MALRKTPLAVGFSGGVETSVDHKQVPTTQLIDLVNGIFSQTKRGTISKRNGYEALSSQIQQAGGAYATARGLSQRDGEVLLFTDQRCYSYRPSADRWADTGEVAASAVTTLPIARTGSYQTQPDVATRNGIRVVAWEDSRGGVWCSVIEAATGRILLSQTQLDSNANAKNVRCVPVGEVLHVLWTREDLGQIKLALINPASPANAPTVSTPVTDLDGVNPFYDAESAPALTIGGVARVVVIAWAVAATGYRIGFLGPAGTFVPPVVNVATAVAGPIAVTYSPVQRSIAVVYINAAALIKAHMLDETLAIVQTYASVATTGTYRRITSAWGDVGPSGGVQLWWAAEITAARSDLTIVESGWLDSISNTASSTTTLRGHGLVSRGWHDGSDAYVMIAHTARFFPYVAALRMSDTSGVNSPGNTIIARLMPGEGSGSLMRTTGAGTRAWTQHLPTVTQDDIGETDTYSRTHAVCVPYRIQLSSQNGDQFSEQGLKLVTLNQLPKYQTVEFGRGLYLASAAPMHYDGDGWHEADFHCAPDFGFDATGTPVDLATAVSIGAAGAIPNGTYLYAFWYEAVDAQGELHRGAVSVKVLVTMAGGPKKFSIALPTCRLTKFSNVRICAARSAQGATGTDSTLPLYRVTSNDVTVTTGDNRYVNNGVTVDTVTLVDNLTDAQLVLREPLYTNGGILSNDPAPWGGGIIAAGKNRIFFDDSTDPHLVRFTQLRADDTAMESSIALGVSTDPFGGALAAIGILDDLVIPFKETAICVFGGPGPLADPSVDPSSNIFSSAELVTSDVGCSSASSVGQTPLGITFQSSKGIKLLAHGRNILDIGNPVQPLSTQNFTRTTLLPDRKSILYLTDTADGFSLLWDYDRNQWSKFSNHLGLDAVVVDGTYHYLRTDSRVFRETPGVYRDDNSRIPLRIETAWIRFAQYLQGWQKALWAYWLGEYISAHTLSIRYRLDYNAAYSAPILSDVNANFDPSLYGAGAYGAGAYGGDGGGTRYQRRVHLNKRCQAISFLVEDIEAEGDFGASFELSELLLIGGALGPDYKVGAARSA